MATAKKTTYARKNRLLSVEAASDAVVDGFYVKASGDTKQEVVVTGETSAEFCNIFSSNSAAANTAAINAACESANIKAISFNNPKGSTYHIDEVVEVPTGKIFKFSNGCKIGGGGTFSIDFTQIEAGNHQIFDDTLTLTCPGATWKTAKFNPAWLGLSPIYKYGDWYYDPTDSSSEDNGATVLVTPNGKRVKRFTDGVILAKWFGATGDGVTDDTDALQNFLDWSIFNGFKDLRLHAGVFKITNGLVAYADRNNNGFPDFITFTLSGEANPHGFNSENASTLIQCDHNDNFALGIQFGKGVRIKNIAFRGQNDLSDLSIAQLYGGNEADFVTNGCRANIYSPYSCIAVDPFNALTLGGNRYPRMTAYYDSLVDTGTTGSSDIIVSDAFIQQFVAGVIFSPNGHSQNAEVCIVRDSWIDNCRDVICNAQSQTRENEVINLKVWGRVHTIINCTTYGEGNGVAPNVVGLNIAGMNYQLVKLTNGWTNASFTNVYAELLYRLGSWGSSTTGLPVSFLNCYFDIPTGHYYTSAKYISGEAVFIGCVLRQYNNKTGFITANANNLTFINCQLSGPVLPYRDIAFPTSSIKITNRTKYINCNAYGLPAPGTFGRIESELNENSDRLSYYQQSVFGVRNANILPAIFGAPLVASSRETLPLDYSYRFAGETAQWIYSLIEPSITIDFSPGVGGAHFTSANASLYRVNDIIVQRNISATIDGEAGVSSTVLGVVESIEDGVVYLTSVTDINPGSTQKTNVVIYVLQPMEFQEPFIGEITAGSNTITNCVFHQRFSSIRPNTFIFHPAFPYNTRIVSIDYDEKEVVLSENSTATSAHAVVEFSKLIGTGSASQDPSTINPALFPEFDSKFGLILKGSVIYNRGTDATLSGWLCTRTGYLGTAKPPTFVSVLASNVNMFNSDGLLTDDRVVDGDEKDLAFLNIENFVQTADHLVLNGNVRLFLGGPRVYSHTVCDGSTDVYVTNDSIYVLANLGVAREISFSLAESIQEGREVLFINKNTSEDYVWSFPAGTVVDLAGNEVTALPNASAIQLKWLSGFWTVINTAGTGGGSGTAGGDGSIYGNTNRFAPQVEAAGSSTLTKTFTQNTSVKMVIIKSVAGIANLKIGTSDGDDDIWSGAIVAGEDKPLQINKWIEASTTWYISNRAGADIKLLYLTDTYNGIW